jgi:hypothetical protein
MKRKKNSEKRLKVQNQIFDFIIFVCIFFSIVMMHLLIKNELLKNSFYQFLSGICKINKEFNDFVNFCPNIELAQLSPFFLK